jgi:diguanylate cyclase (GGDEF)-like protein
LVPIFNGVSQLTTGREEDGVTHDPALMEVQHLEDMVRPAPAAAVEAASRWLAAHAGPGCDPVLRQRVRLVRADGQARLGQPETSVLVMREINAWAVEHDDAWLLARSHRLLSARYRRAGDSGLALEHAIAAVDVPLPDARPVDRADHLLGLADALGNVGSFEQSLRRYGEAQALAQSAGNIALWMHVLNNIAYTQYMAGHADESVENAERLMAVSVRHDVALDVYDRDTIARAYTLVGRLDDAVAVLLPAVGAGAPSTGEQLFDGQASGMLTLAEIQRMSGALDDAQATLDRAREICRLHGLAGISIDILREQAELHASNGRFELAFVTFKEFHTAFTKLTALERETRARTLQAIYEADEARRDSARFRELSVRDPLTGLRNRRYIDEALGMELMQALDTSAPLTLAILDLDHFKVVNDQRSHDVGDKVLIELATILERAVAHLPRATASRLGGEEFLLMFPGVDHEDAVRLLETLCRTVREHPWHPITDGLAITISIGVATAPHDGVDRTPLLAGADRRLYIAKRQGRDRVVADDVAAARLTLVT